MRLADGERVALLEGLLSFLQREQREVEDRLERATYASKHEFKITMDLDDGIAWLEHEASVLEACLAVLDEVL